MKLRVEYVHPKSRPEWLVLLVGLIKGYYPDDIAEGDVDETLRCIEGIIDEAVITTRNTKSKGYDLRRIVTSTAIHLYNQNGSLVLWIKIE